MLSRPIVASLGARLRPTMPMSFDRRLKAYVAPPIEFSEFASLGLLGSVGSASVLGYIALAPNDNSATSPSCPRRSASIWRRMDDAGDDLCSTSISSQIDSNTSIWRRIDDAEMEEKLSQRPRQISIGPVRQRRAAFVANRSKLNGARPQSGETTRSTSIWRRIEDTERDIAASDIWQGVTRNTSIWRRQDDADKELAPL